jgi:hypothetical protein
MLHANIGEFRLKNAACSNASGVYLWLPETG